VRVLYKFMQDALLARGLRSLTRDPPAAQADFA
jgi:hypothetical protein